MTREEIIEMLLPAWLDAGEAPVAARRRLWRMSSRALQQELLMRGLIDYRDPDPDEDAHDESDADAGGYAGLRWSFAPRYLD